MDTEYQRGFRGFQRDVADILRTVCSPFLKIGSVQLRAAVITLILASVIWAAAWLILGLFPFGEQSLCTNDGYAQYMPFLSEFWSIFRQGQSPLYSLYGGLGSNFYLTICYYLMSPFTFVALLFDRTQIPAAANLIIVLKNILVCVLMAWYLPSRTKSRRSMPAVACALTYGLGYYFMGYAVNFMWMDSIALLPLMLYGMERLDTRKGRAFYLISLAAAIFMNFYMGAILCIFLALYEVVIVMRFKDGQWKSILWFALCSICAAMIAGAVLLPVVEGMLSDNVSRMSPPDFEIFNGWPYIFSRLLPDASVVRITHNRGTINLYMGTACLFFCLIFLGRRGISLRTRLGLAGLCLLFFTATQISLLNYVFHGFYMQRQVPNRFGFLVGFLACLMMYEGLVRLKTIHLPELIFCALLDGLFFCVVCALSTSKNTWIAPLLCAVITADLLAAGRHKPILLSWMIIAESCGCLAMSAPGDLSESFTNMKPDLEAASFTGTGRSDILCSDIVNAPALYGFKGVSSFNSVINPDTAGILGRLGFASGENYYRIFGHTAISDLLLGIDLLVSDEDELVPAPFVQAAKVDDLILWRSPYTMPIGTALLSSEEQLDDTNKFANMNNILPDSFALLHPAASVETEGECDGVQSAAGGFTVKNLKDGDRTTVTLNPFEARQAYVYGFMSGAGDFAVYKNGETLHKDRYEGHIVYLGDVTEKDRIEIEFISDDDRDSVDLKLQLASLMPDAIPRAIESLTTFGLRDQNISPTVITGSYTSADPCSMVFTIPYDPGWSALVNGEKAEVESYRNGFVKIELPAGNSQIRLSYFPVGLKTGLLISAQGLILAALILLIPTKRRKKKKQILESEADTKTEAEPLKPESPDRSISTPRTPDQTSEDLQPAEDLSTLADSEDPNASCSKLPETIQEPVQEAEEEIVPPLPIQEEEAEEMSTYSETIQLYKNAKPLHPEADALARSILAAPNAAPTPLHRRRIRWEDQDDSGKEDQ